MAIRNNRGEKPMPSVPAPSEEGKRSSIVEAAKEYQKSHRIKPGLDYSWINDFAKESHTRLVASFERVDAKAGQIITYVGSAGFVTLAVLLTAKPENAWILRWSAPAFLCALASLLVAILARQTTTLGLPPNVRTAIEYNETFGDSEEAQAEFLKLWHGANEMTLEAIGKKAKLLKISTYFLFAAIALVVIPFACAAYFS